ncbi:MAG: hypothetical protein AAF198_02870 [Pseudomonadota bacterium]
MLKEHADFSYVQNQLMLKGIYRTGNKTPLLNVLFRGLSHFEKQFANPSSAKLIWHRINCPSGLGYDRLAFTDFLASLEADVLANLSSGKTKLVLDYSHEGRRVKSGRGFPRIEQQLSEIGLTADCCFVLTQNRSALASVADKDIGLKVGYAHSHGSTVYLNLKENGAFAAHGTEFGTALIDEGLPRKNFISLNRELRAHRALLVARLHENGFLGNLSFSHDQVRFAFVYDRVTTELTEISTKAKLELNQRMVTDLLNREFVFKIDEPEGNRADNYTAVYDMPVSVLRQSELFIVTETEMSSAALQRITEKTIKAVISGLPFVVFGNPYSIKFLRDLGFNVHDGLVDHGYDVIEDPAMRFEAAWAEVKRLLAQMPGLIDRNLDFLWGASETNKHVFEDVILDLMLIKPLHEILTWID